MPIIEVNRPSPYLFDSSASNISVADYFKAVSVAGIVEDALITRVFDEKPVDVFNNIRTPALTTVCDMIQTEPLDPVENGPGGISMFGGGSGRSNLLGRMIFNQMIETGYVNVTLCPFQFDLAPNTYMPDESLHPFQVMLKIRSDHRVYEIFNGPADEPNANVVNRLLAMGTTRNTRPANPNHASITLPKVVKVYQYKKAINRIKRERLGVFPVQEASNVMRYTYWRWNSVMQRYVPVTPDLINLPDSVFENPGNLAAFKKNDYMRGILAAGPGDITSFHLASTLQAVPVVGELLKNVIFADTWRNVGEIKFRRIDAGGAGGAGGGGNNVGGGSDGGHEPPLNRPRYNDSDTETESEMDVEDDHLVNLTPPPNLRRRPNPNNTRQTNI